MDTLSMNSENSKTAELYRLNLINPYYRIT